MFASRTMRGTGGGLGARRAAPSSLSRMVIFARALLSFALASDITTVWLETARISAAIYYLLTKVALARLSIAVTV